jgi:hypothetical protein
LCLVVPTEAHGDRESRRKGPRVDRRSQSVGVDSVPLCRTLKTPLILRAPTLHLRSAIWRERWPSWPLRDLGLDASAACGDLGSSGQDQTTSCCAYSAGMALPAVSK